MKKIKKEEKKEKPFVVTFLMGGKTISGKGATALLALQDIHNQDKIISKGIMPISQGKKKKEMLFMPVKLKRIFYPNAQPILIKWLAQGLK